MSIRPFLWRMVLCISVILNGSALASPSVLMATPLPQQSADHMAAGTPRPSSRPACHDHAAGMASGAAHQHTPATPIPSKGGHATPDCCQPGTCGCACVQSQATIAIAGFDLMAVHAATGGQARARHDEPVLPHLIRPPIG